MYCHVQWRVVHIAWSNITAGVGDCCSLPGTQWCSGRVVFTERRCIVVTGPWRGLRGGGGPRGATGGRKLLLLCPLSSQLAAVEWTCDSVRSQSDLLIHNTSSPVYYSQQSFQEAVSGPETFLQRVFLAFCRNVKEIWICLMVQSIKSPMNILSKNFLVNFPDEKVDWFSEIWRVREWFDVTDLVFYWVEECDLKYIFRWS